MTGITAAVAEAWRIQNMAAVSVTATEPNTRHSNQTDRVPHSRINAWLA